MRRHPEQCHRKVVDRLTAAPRLNVGRRVCGTLDERSKRRGRRLLRLWAECPCRIALWAAHLGQSELPRILLVTDLLVLRAGQRGEKRHHVIDLGLRQRQWLHVLVEPGVRDSITLVVVIHYIPQCFHRPVVEVGPSHEDISQARRLERRDITLLPRDEEAPKDRLLARDRCRVDSRQSPCASSRSACCAKGPTRWRRI